MVNDEQPLDLSIQIRTNNAFQQSADSVATSLSLHLLSESATQCVPQPEHQQRNTIEQQLHQQVIQQSAEVSSLTNRNNQQQVVDMMQENPVLNEPFDPYQIWHTFRRLHSTTATLVNQSSIIPPHALVCRRVESAIQNEIRDHLSNNRADIKIEGVLKVTNESGNNTYLQIKTTPDDFSITSITNPHPLFPTKPESEIHKSGTQQSATFDNSRANSAVPSQPLLRLSGNFDLPSGLNDDSGNRESAGARSHCRGRRSFSCNQCDETNFHTVTQLDKHTIEVHGSYRCHICPNRTYTLRSNYRRHSLKHVDLEPFQCLVCKKGYYRSDHLMKHMAGCHPTVNARENIAIHRDGFQGLDHPKTS
ncbi:hypothetical protein ACTXT7_008539 [Hymenolepis weldensis]